MTVDEKIKMYREKKGYTLEELGNRVGVGKSTIRKWENGIIKNMRRDKRKRKDDIIDRRYFCTLN